MNKFIIIFHSLNTIKKFPSILVVMHSISV